MASVLKLRNFVRPYWRPAVLSLLALVILVLLDLAIPRMIQELIDKGIHRPQHDHLGIE